MPQIAIGALIAAGAATIAASAATIAAGGAFLFAAGTAAAFFAKTFVIAFASGYLLQELAPKPSRPRAPGGNVRGNSNIQQDSVIPKRWILGRARVNGALVWFRHLDDRLASVLVLSAGSIDSIERIWVNGEEVEITRDPATGVIEPADGSRFIYRKPSRRTVTYTEIIYVGPEEGGGRPVTERADRDRGGGWNTDGLTVASDIGDDPSTRGGDLPPDGGVPAPRGGRSAPPDIPQPQRVGGGGEGGGRDRGPGRYNALQPGYKRVQKTKVITEYTNVPTIKITEYFAGDGSQGERIREIAAEPLPDDSGTEATVENDLEWTDAHRLEGVSYVLVELLQPPHEQTPEGVQGRLFQRIPSLEFQVKGLRVGYPVADPDADGGVRMTAPAWTDNAAVLRYWYLTTRRLIRPSLIDLSYFTSARLKCDETLMLSDSVNYDAMHPRTSKRYTINGVVNSGDSTQALERQFDLCWQGSVVEWAGGYLFRPGSDLDVSHVIPEADIINDPIIRPSLPRESRANEVSIALEQSAVEDFRAAEYRVADTDKQTADGERLPIDIGQQSFLNQPVQALNILYQQLRQQSASMSVDIRVKPRDDFRYVGLIPGDKIELNLPEYGIGVGAAGEEGASSVRYFRVVSNQVNPDFSVDLRLTQWPDGWFEDRFEFPEIRPRTLIIPAPVAPPVPLANAVITHDISNDGVVTWNAKLFFAPTHHRAIAWVDSPLTGRQEKELIGGEAEFTFHSPGTYTFHVYNVSTDGRASSVATARAVASFDDIPLPKPELQRDGGGVQQITNILHIRMQSIPNRDVAGMEVKYTRGPLNANLGSLAALTEDNWDTADEMNVSFTAPRRGGLPMHAEAVIPVTGSYRVFVRLVSNLGNLSPITQVGFFRYERQAGAQESRSSFPEWNEDADNMVVWPHDQSSRLVPDRSNLHAVSFNDWNGASDWPFGENDGHGFPYSDRISTAYTTGIIDMESNASREVTVTVELDAPDGVANDEDAVDITLAYSSNANLSSPVRDAVRDGTPITITARSMQARVHLRNTRSNALIALTVGWRDLV